MGHTFRFAGGVDAGERDFGHGGTSPLCHFVARLVGGEAMSEVCRDFGISRKTGYKIFNRHKDEGLEALTDRSRRPVRYSNPLPGPGEVMIVRFKKGKPHWGEARKIRELLVRELAGDGRIPARSTAHAVLDRHALVNPARKRNRANKAVGTALLKRSIRTIYVRRLQGRVRARQ
ncbi:MAG: helix-turn-helix domain-containing protein [Hydrogenophaga sp.]|nr:helix-turn-helix domain-containing protein [Hydrogenophaga sp.]